MYDMAPPQMPADYFDYNDPFMMPVSDFGGGHPMDMGFGGF
jgi:hypothetical protein